MEEPAQHAAEPGPSHQAQGILFAAAGAIGFLLNEPFTAWLAAGT